MISRTPNPESGFIALISAVIIAAILLTITVALSFSGFYNRSDILNTEYKARSSALAEACADYAILQISESNTIPANTVVTVNSSTCKVISVTGVSPMTIQAQGVYQNSYTNLKVVVTPATNAPPTINSWQELAHF